MKRNPVTQRKIKTRLPFAKIKTTALSTWFKRKGVGLGESWSVMSDLGLTGLYSVLGKGAFAVVLEDPVEARRVIKFTSDASDAQTAAELLAMYRDPEQADNAHAVAPMIYGVSELEYANTKTARLSKFWIIKLERVIPLSLRLVDGHPVDTDEATGRVLHAASFIVNKAHQARTLKTEQAVYRRVKKGKPVTPELHQAMIVALDNLASNLEETASKLHNPDYVRKYYEGFATWMGGSAPAAGDLLYAMGGKIRILIERMDMPIIDLHAGNWGVRIEENGELDPVIIDFGLSSGGEQREADKEMLELE